MKTIKAPAGFLGLSSATDILRYALDGGNFLSDSGDKIPGLQEIINTILKYKGDSVYVDICKKLAKHVYSQELQSGKRKKENICSDIRVNYFSRENSIEVKIYNEKTIVKSVIIEEGMNTYDFFKTHTDLMISIRDFVASLTEGLLRSPEDR